MAQHTGIEESRHTQEPTSLSLTETLQEGFAGIDDIATTTSPQPTKPHKPVERPTIDPRVLPPVIPPEHRARTLILCFDGTGDQFDQDNSNIVQFMSLLKKDDRTKQMVYYQTGIGTYTSPKVATPVMSALRKKWDVMFASSLHAHVMSGYEFLMQNYVAGDRICIFGFSRGAYTARSLAGMLHKVGLLPADNREQVPFAYKMHTRTDPLGWELSNDFKKAFSINVDIEFIGVWDTVDSVGIVPKRLPFTTSNTIVRTFRHAVSLDERRAKFKANLWNRPNDVEAQLGITPPGGKHLPLAVSDDDLPTSKFSLDQIPTLDELPKLGGFTKAFNGDKNQASPKVPMGPTPLVGNGKKRVVKQSSHEEKLNTMEKIYSTQGGRVTDIEEVWFAGCHCDVGGGSVSNKTRHSLARIPLRWMIRECFKANTGIMFLTDKLYDIGLDPSTLYPYIVPRPKPHEVRDNKLRNHPAKEIPIRQHSVLTKKKEITESTAPHASSSQPSHFLGSEEEEELMDALSPAYDQLKISKGWWFLELIPLKLRYQRGDNKWVEEWKINRANPRYIPQQRRNGVKVHRSVKMRMEAEYEDERKRQKGKKYQPKAHFRVDPAWVD